MSYRTLLGRDSAMIFPGQGSQSVGMGKELAEKSVVARETLQEADEVIGFSLSNLAFDGPADELEDTYNAQPAILAVSVAAQRAVKDRSLAEGIRPASWQTAGHSLGHFTALTVAGVIDFPTALKLVRERGRLMKEAGELRPGGMAAILGLEAEQLESVCEEASSAGIINVANDNCPGQIVISGEVGALEVAMELAKTMGAKRAVRLGVSIASHSPLMKDASDQFYALLADIEFDDPYFPIVSNVTGQPLTKGAELKSDLRHHMERPVQWTRSVRTLIAGGADLFIELGSGAVLGGLIKRIDRNVTNIATAELLAD